MYTVRIDASALKSLNALPKDDRKRLRDALDALAEDPRPSGVKKLKGSDNDWRIRVGDYRILYEIRDKALVVRVIRIGNRKGVYH